MDLKTFRNAILAAVALTTACFGQGSVFSLDGGSQASYVPGILAGGSTALNITNTGFLANNTSAGNICANVYAFNSTPNMVLCCSCLVQTNQTVNVTIQSDLMSGITPIPSSVTVHVLAVPSGSGGNATTCGSASTITSSQVIPFGMTVFKSSTTWRAGAGFEAPFTPYILGPVTVTNLATACTTAQKQTCTCSPGAR